VSPQNQFFVLHDSQGFEPGDLSNFETVREFVKQRSRHDLPLSERIHGLWLCTETPTAGGRVFETGDEELLKFAQKIQLPIVIVFTQYDRRAELEEDDTLNSRSVEEAWKAFEICLLSLRHRLGIGMLPYARVSVRSGFFQEDISELVQITRNIVKKRLEGSAWALWAVSQRATLPAKIDACVT